MSGAEVGEDVRVGVGPIKSSFTQLVSYYAIVGEKRFRSHATSRSDV